MAKPRMVCPTCGHADLRLAIKRWVTFPVIGVIAKEAIKGTPYFNLTVAVGEEQAANDDSIRFGCANCDWESDDGVAAYLELPVGVVVLDPVVQDL